MTGADTNVGAMRGAAGMIGASVMRGAVYVERYVGARRVDENGKISSAKGDRRGAAGRNSSKHIAGATAGAMGYAAS
jgi:hypothetical protein